MARPRSDIRLRIVHAARVRFLKDGVDGASLRRIAREARTNIGMVYYYFPTKDDLFFAVVEEIYAGLLKGFATALTPDAPVQERIRRVYVRMGNASQEELDVIRLVIREILVSSARLNRLLDRFQRGHLPLVLNMLVDGIGDGTLDRRRHPVLLMLSMFALGAVPQTIRRFVGDRPPFEGLPRGEQLSNELVEILLGGIGAEPAERSTITVRPATEKLDAVSPPRERLRTPRKAQ